MPTKLRDLATITFKGQAFQDHGLEIGYLSELISYKEILVEGAKEIWRSLNPGKERLPKGFEESIVIKLCEIIPGSTVAVLRREVEDKEELFECLSDEVDQASEMIEEGIEAVSKGAPLPAGFPVKIIPIFSKFGKNIKEGEVIEVKTPKRRRPVFYTPETREKLLTWSDKYYYDMIDIVGEVRATDLDGLKFELRLADGIKVPGQFEPAKEELITEALRDHSTLRLRVKGKAEFTQSDGRMKRITSVDRMELFPSSEPSYDDTARPIWEEISDLAKDIPDEQLSLLPTDGSQNYRNYLYGEE